MSTEKTEAEDTLPDIVKYIVTGFIITFILIYITGKIERSPIGHRFERLTFEGLQRLLPVTDTGKRLPVALVDISDIPGGKAGQVTPRTALMSVIAAVARQHPRAIGLDLDCAPDRALYASPNEDPRFFRMCLGIGDGNIPTKKACRNLQEGLTDRGLPVPIFLGIKETVGQGPKGWLYAEDFQKLAAALLADTDDVMRIPRWIRVKDLAASTATRPIYFSSLPTLSGSLAEAYSKRLPSPVKPLRYILDVPRNISQSEEATTEERGESSPEMQEELFDTERDLVNYSNLEMFFYHPVDHKTVEALSGQGDMFKDQVVLIGDITGALDTFPIPARDNKPFPGVCVQACATVTLIKQPLYTFQERVRVILDLVISGLLILLVAGIRTMRMRSLDSYLQRDGILPQLLHRIRPYLKTEEELAWETIQAVVGWGAILCVLVSGMLLVRWSGILWLDCCFIVAALMMHPKADKAVEQIKNRLNHEPPTASEEREARNETASEIPLPAHIPDTQNEAEMLQLSQPRVKPNVRQQKNNAPRPPKPRKPKPKNNRHRRRPGK